MLAIFAGIFPAITFNPMLNKIKNIALPIGIVAILFIPVKADTMKLTGTHINNAIPIPNNPAINPSITVSALNTLVISFLLAPIALKIPISFVLSYISDNGNHNT